MISIENLIGTELGTIQDTLTTIENDEFHHSVWAHYHELVQSVEEANAIARQQWERELDEWEQERPSLPEGADPADAQYFFANWERRNPKPTIKGFTVMNPPSSDWQQFANWLYGASNSMVQYCTNVSDFDELDLTKPSALKEYKRRRQQVFLRVAANAFPSEWAEYQQEQAELQRAKVAKADATILNQLEAVSPTAPVAERDSTGDMVMGKALALMAELSEAVRLLPDALMNDIIAAQGGDAGASMITASDQESLAKIMTMVLTANSSQLKSMEEVVKLLDRGSAAKCKPMSRAAISFLYNWLDSLPANLRFTTWFKYGEGKQWNNRIRARLGLPKLPDAMDWL